jgi:hypothetical protein
MEQTSFLSKCWYRTRRVILGLEIIVGGLIGSAIMIPILGLTIAITDKTFDVKIDLHNPNEETDEKKND